MYTTCPYCHTSFKITAKQLKVAAGKVRCGHCNKVFDAIAALSDSLNEKVVSSSLPQINKLNHSEIETKNTENSQAKLLSLSGKASEHQKKTSRHTEVIHKTDVGHRHKAVSSHERANSLEQDSSQEPFSNIEPENGEPEVYFPEQFEQTQAKILFGWLFLAMILAATLAGQHLHFNSYRYAQNSLYRPLLENLCNISNCQLPLQHDVKKITVVDSTQVRVNEQLSDILDIQLRFRNQAEFIQSYPLLKITFSDTTGQLVAERIFTPLEYLALQQDQAETIHEQIQQGLRPQQNSAVFMQIVDPAPQISLGFEVVFL